MSTKKLIHQIILLLFRWLVSVVGIWVCISLFGETTDDSWSVFLLAGLIFAIVNAFVKPIATIFALPLIFLTMGLFIIILNAGMIALTVWLVPELHVTFWGAILSAITMSLINYLVNFLVPAYNKK